MKSTLNKSHLSQTMKFHVNVQWIVKKMILFTKESNNADNQILNDFDISISGFVKKES